VQHAVDRRPSARNSDGEHVMDTRSMEGIARVHWAVDDCMLCWLCLAYLFARVFCAMRLHHFVWNRVINSKTNDAPNYQTHSSSYTVPTAGINKLFAARS